MSPSYSIVHIKEVGVVIVHINENKINGNHKAYFLFYDVSLYVLVEILYIRRFIEIYKWILFESCLKDNKKTTIFNQK